MANKSTYNDREWIKARSLAGLAQDAHVKPAKGGGMANPALFGHDLFGHPIEQPSRGKVADNFVCPPFTVLSSREGWWQERKAAWIGRGIKSEVGRGETGERPTYDSDGFVSTSGNNGQAFRIHKTPVASQNGRLTFDVQSIKEDGFLSDNNSGTSIFDPVLCELVYRWFCPPSGLVLDPFAGGSVRGIVAALLNRRYHGIDLRPEQIAANREQAAKLTPDAHRIPVKVSAASVRQLFHPCEPDYIKNVCHAACGCRGSNSEPARRLGGICVTIHPSEVVHIESLGGTVRDGFVAPDARGMCPFNDADGLCSIHFKGKPFGCAASPFTLNDNDTLIVRNRYRLLKCYRADGAVPAYIAHRASLDRIFGTAEAARIAEHLDADGGDLTATMDPDAYVMLRDNDDAKHGGTTTRGTPALAWVCGDAATELPSAPMADLVFSCPPYADLERYSDDPRDLSTMAWPAFLDAYRAIVAAACARLRPDRFACFVVGDVRDKDGLYRNLPGETIRAFTDAGLRLYNEAILATPAGSLPIRINAQFSKSRKMGKTHQNVLVFVKGCPRRATAGLEAIG